MKTLLALIALAATSLAVHATGVYMLGGPIINPANQHTYYLLSDSTWTDAEAYAQSLGGHLATINNSTEQSWVYNTFSTYGSGDRTLWIGLNDVAVEGNFVWTSGEPVTYTHWSMGEPNNFAGNEDYGFIFRPSDSRAGFWNDDDNIGTIANTASTIPVNGVVEVVPEPGSLALVGFGMLGFILSKKIQKPTTVSS
ncbi:MAG: lectin-like protein [Verrucomicrobiota bacterium]